MTLTIACFGDSTCYGYTTNGRVGGSKPAADGTVSSRVAMPYPAALQTLLQIRRPDVTVENNGVSGTTCADWLAGTGGVPMPWAATMSATPAQWVLILLGINDVPAELVVNYPLLVQGAEAAGKRVIIQTPNALDISWGSITHKVEAIRAVQAAHPNSILVDFYAYTQGLGADWHDFLSYSEMFNAWSGIHPTQEGYDTMAAFARDVLVPVIGWTAA